MRPDLKRYYLMQFSYWLQQLVVLVLGLEKPRKDYLELVIHHFVTLWLVGYVVPHVRTFCPSDLLSQLELSHQPNVHRKRGLYEHGHT